MKKSIIAGVLVLLLSQLPVAAQQTLNSVEISKQIRAVNRSLTDVKIKLSENIIEELERASNPEIILSMRSIHSFTMRYGDTLEYERTMILMYPYVRESVKLYFSGLLRDNLRQKKKEIDWFMENLAKHESNIGNRDISAILAKLKQQIESGQMLVDRLIKHYASENQIYRSDNR